MFGRRTTSSIAEAPEQDAGPAVADGPAAPTSQDGHDGFRPLWEPSRGPGRKSVDALLLERGQITEAHLAQARQVTAQTPGKTLAQVLLSMNAASEAQILSALAETLSLSFETPDKNSIELRAFEMLPLDYIRKHSVLPIRLEDNTLVVGTADPANVFMIDEVKRTTRRDVKVVVITAADVNKLAEQLSAHANDVKVDDIIKDMSDDDVQLVAESAQDEVTDLEKMGNESPVIRFVNYLIFDAIKQGASDIHVEPKEKALKIRYRIDGVLFETMSPPHTMQASIVSRLKIMASLDIAERRLPQDGRIRAMVHNRKVDLRLSTLPTPHGEKCVHAHPRQPLDPGRPGGPGLRGGRADDLA